MVDVRPYLEGNKGQRHPTSTSADVAYRVINNDNGDAIIVGESIEGKSEASAVWKIYRNYYNTNNLSFEKKKWPQNSNSKADNDYQHIWDSSDTATITGITAANPPVVTTDGVHGWASNDKVFIEDAGGMTEVNSLNSADRIYKITVLSTTTFSLQDEDGVDIDGSGYTTYTSGGTASRSDMLNHTYS